MSRKDIQSARLVFWTIWTVSITMPISVTLHILIGTLWVYPVVSMVSTVIGFNYCEWLIKRRQWRADNTIVLCHCGHEQIEHKDDKNCLHAGLGGHGGILKRDCVCVWYAPRFWRMSGRT
ncbi:membrane protein [Arthrobacter phage Qui]|uniref:Membrane protein n=1 Tax=Arthrobacter phage Qui TaxID=2603260 RepID=A0A5B8WHY2_9CAUD|nr:membrane protein [Arthrobacter phage Qui]QED11659.1 membrane protein [Arthrobacter phage Qui]QOC56490.1 membrane protein [Arthrobacter phage Paella]